MATFDDDVAVLVPEAPARLKLICTCGHAEARHIVMPGRGQQCDALKGRCPCRDLRLVLEVSDARVFMCSADADVHPLTAGVIKLRARGGTWNWAEGYGWCEFTPPGMGRCNAEAKAATFVGNGETTQLRCEEHAA